ncbi:MAG: class I SAM-dependent rRNA methyltransferase [Pseudomonadales bacterium]|nr:class I SAM-dependent rRNA methyltransferase [Pseudomonadales bacterium]
MEILKLKPREDRRIRQGHLWVYSNEIDVGATPLKDFQAGDEAVLVNDSGKPLGRVLVNPHALICARVVSRDAEVGLDQGLLEARIADALALRERLYPGQGCYRLVFGEGDALSGMVVDRFGDVLSVQLSTAGLERRRDLVIDALRKVVAPRSIVFKHDGGMRDIEHLEKYLDVIGEPLPERIPLTENGVRFEISLTGGQKTGWYYDHRENRARLAPFLAEARVLDAFSYLGAWGLQALAGGAASLMAVDGSAPALEGLGENAALQGVADRVDLRRGDAFAVLGELADAGERFDVVVIDPPALIKRRKDLKAGQRAYERLAALGMRLTRNGGLLVFGSCSLHFDRAMLREALRGAARHVERQAHCLGVAGAGPDHPFHPAIPESDYLKAAFVRVLQPGRGGAM